MRPFLVLVVLGLAGCAAGGECGPDWRALGERDGRMNYGSQVSRYEARCTTKVDTAAYDEGYARGSALRPPPNW